MSEKSDREKAAEEYIMLHYPPDVWKSKPYDGIRQIVRAAFETGAAWGEKRGFERCRARALEIIKSLQRKTTTAEHNALLAISDARMAIEKLEA